MRELAFESIRQRIFGGRANDKKIGRYVIQRYIGRGGMGVVYAAHDPELDRQVAVKVIGEAWTGAVADRMREALLRDARSAAKLSHPNVVEVHDYGVDRGEVFLVMELIEGTDLEGWLRQRRRSWQEVVEIFVAAGRGLVAAHEQGLVHRDFKPSNVLVGEGRVCVADFGLARSYAVSSNEPSPGEVSSCSGSITQTDGTVGTPRYMSPEQYIGEGVGPRSDQFAFCVALYQSLFGHLPFEGGSLKARALNVTEGRARWPDRGHGVPRRLVRLVMRGLARYPEARHESMAVLIDRLHGMLQRRRRILVSSGLGGAVLGAACTLAVLPPKPVVETWPCEQRGRLWTDALERDLRAAQPEVGPAQRRPLEQSLELARGYARSWEAAWLDNCEATHLRLEQFDELMNLRSACLARRRRVFSMAMEQVQRGSTGRDAAALISGLTPVGDCDPELIRERQWADVWRVPSDRSRSPEAERRREELEPKLEQALIASMVRDHIRALKLAHYVAVEAAEEGLRDHQARALLIEGRSRAALARNPRRRREAIDSHVRALLAAIEAGAWRVAAEALVAQVELDASSAGFRFERLEQARSFARRLTDSDELQAKIDAAHGELLLRLGRADEALARFRSAVEAGERSGGHDSPATLVATNRLAGAQRERGSLEQARDTWQRLRLQLQDGHADDPLLPVVIHNLALLEADQGRWDVARALYGEALVWLEYQTRGDGTGGRLVPASVQRLGLLVADHAEIKAEVPDLKTRERSADDLVLAAEICAGIGSMLSRTGHYQEASDVLAEVVEQLKAQGRTEGSRLAFVLDRRAEVELLIGNLGQAEALAAQELAVVTASSPEPRDVARVQMLRARIATRRGDRRRAVDLLTEARDAISGQGTDLVLQAEIAFNYARALVDAGASRGRAAEPLRDARRLLHKAGGHPEAIRELEEWEQEQGLINAR